MKIRKPTTHLVEIGSLDKTIRFPTAPRKRCNQKTICMYCGKSVDDEYFIAGFKKGLPNMIFHERCLEEDKNGRD